MNEELITIEVDGRELSARPGTMLIEVTDAAGIYVPRFCYHKNLTVAANCRMCLVEVEKAPKPLPACATPVADGMKVSTRSQYAVDAQHATMEFLLINHPLDCPICDQGGECELQDLAMGYGGDVSRYTERKRVVRDKNIGPLVQTDMTRCIHCTRCVRFGEEIAGLRELGATGRSEHMAIGTYVEKAMTSELSGNVIDLCPVGALTNKPYRYSARAWELQQRNGVAMHDSLGSNVHFHVKGQVIKRVIPRENSEINETWLSDRDRYSYEGMNHASRLTTPRLKQGNRWVGCTWDEALDVVVANIRKITNDDPGQLGALASPSSTTEEFYLLQNMMRGLGCHNIDHRLRQSDFSDREAEPKYPSLDSLSSIENADAVLLVGSFPRHESPLLNARIRKAAISGAAVMHVDTYGRRFNYDLYAEKVVKPSRVPQTLEAIVVATKEYKSKGMAVSPEQTPSRDELTELMGRKLAESQNVIVLVGATAQTHPQRALLWNIVSELTEVVDATVGDLAGGANAAGAWLTGVVPHLEPGSCPSAQLGLNAREMIEQPRRGYILLGVEPDLDCASAAETQTALENADFVLALSAYENEAVKTVGDVILPMAIYGENEGSLINLMGNWQSFRPAVNPQGEARPAWKILRMLGDMLKLPGFSAVSCEELTDEVKSLVGDIRPSGRGKSTLEKEIVDFSDEGLELIVDVPMYASDPLVRHAPALQEMPQSGDDYLRMSTATATPLRVVDGVDIRVSVGEAEVVANVKIDEAVPEGTCLLHAGRAANARVALNGARVKLGAVHGEPG